MNLTPSDEICFHQPSESREPNFASKIPSPLTGVPALALDQAENAAVEDIYSITASASASYGAMVTYAPPVDGQRLAFYRGKVPGDSGNPGFWIINGRLVLLNVWTFGGAGSGTSLTYWKSVVNSLMTSLGGGYQLTEVDLSSFPSY